MERQPEKPLMVAADVVVKAAKAWDTGPRRWAVRGNTWACNSNNVGKQKVRSGKPFFVGITFL